MAKLWKGPVADENTREEALSGVTELCDYLKALGACWSSCRNAVVGGGPLRLFEAVPPRLASMLDDAADVVVCFEHDCLEPVHGDWDFCEEHGKKRE